MSGRRRHPAVTAAADQAQAAAADVARRVRERYEYLAPIEGLVSRRPPLPVGETGEPTGPHADVIKKFTRLFASAEFGFCPHANSAITPAALRRTGPQPDALVWESGHPGFISCAPCARALPDPSIEEDHRCDACGHTGGPGDLLEVVSYVLPANVEHAARSGHVAPPLICFFGLCQPCSQASHSAG